MYGRKSGRVSDEEMRSYFQAGGMTDLEIAEKTGYKRNTVAMIRLRLGYPPGGRELITTPQARIKTEDRKFLKTFAPKWEALTAELKERFGDKLKDIELKREDEEK